MHYVLYNKQPCFFHSAGHLLVSDQAPRICTPGTLLEHLQRTKQAVACFIRRRLLTSQVECVGENRFASIRVECHR